MHAFRVAKGGGQGEMGESGGSDEGVAATVWRRQPLPPSAIAGAPHQKQLHVSGRHNVKTNKK